MSPVRVVLHAACRGIAARQRIRHFTASRHCRPRCFVAGEIILADVWSQSLRHSSQSWAERSIEDSFHAPTHHYFGPRDVTANELHAFKRFRTGRLAQLTQRFLLTFTLQPQQSKDQLSLTNPRDALHHDKPQTQ